MGLEIQRSFKSYIPRPLLVPISAWGNVEVILADYQVSAANVFASPGIPTGLSEELLELDEVTKLSRTRATVVGYNQRPLILGAVDETVFDLVKTDDIEGSREGFLEENTIGILRPTAEREELSVGDKVTLTIPEEGEKVFTVSYIFDWTTQPPAEFFQRRPSLPLDR